MGNPLTNNLPAAIDQFLMDMAQTVGPFDYGDVIKFADKIADVKTDKNIAIIRKLYKAAKDAAEYDDDDEFNAIGEDLNDIITGVKDFNQPGAIFADTRTFKYEDSQNSEYNDLGTDVRTGEKFPDSFEDDEDLPFGSYDPDYPNPYPDEEDDPDEVRDMGEMYGVPRGATPEEALKHFESKKASKKNNLKEDTDLDSLVGKKVKCIKGASHPNMGKLFDKGRTYKVSKSEDGRICVGKVYVGKEFFDSHFEVEDALDENYEDIYSATFQAKGFVNQMRKTYDDDTIKMAVENCLKESKRK